MRGGNVLYIVEGETEKRLIDALKRSYIISGRTIVYDLIKEKLTLNTFFLRTIASNTIVIIVFDTDVDQEQSVQRLFQNIELLKKVKHVKEILLIPQVSNLEEELIYSTNLKKIKDLINCKSEKDFKKSFLKIHDDYLMKQLKKYDFQLSKLWCRSPQNKYKVFRNQSFRIKSTLK